jgi:hypothetical protein
MFKELVSLAIIVGFILNVVYVEHPNTTSYTITFVLSLAVVSPFGLAWRYWNTSRRLRVRNEAVEGGEEEVFVSVSEATGLSKDTQSSADVEMGSLQTTQNAVVVEGA